MYTKKIIYLLVTLVVLGLVAYFFFWRDSMDQDMDVLSDQELSWVASFPETVPEYTGGDIGEIQSVEQDISRFEDEVLVTIENTNRDELDEYLDELFEDGWLVTYESPEGTEFYNIRLYINEYRISLDLDEDVLRFGSYVVN